MILFTTLTYPSIFFFFFFPLLFELKILTNEQINKLTKEHVKTGNLEILIKKWRGSCNRFKQAQLGVWSTWNGHGDGTIGRLRKSHS